MIDIPIFGVAILMIIVAGVVAYFLPGGCTGDCRQGRDPCNCRKQQEK